MNYYFQRNDSGRLYNPSEAYNLGNLFVDLYDGYKNYKPAKLEGKTKQEKDYLELSRVAFAMHEVNLYLDLHPDDMMMLNLFNDYRKMYVDLEEKYENAYGPLNTCSEALEKKPFAWVEKDFPWEGGANV